MGDRTRATFVISTRRWRGPRRNFTLGTISLSLNYPRKNRTLAAAVPWIVKGDAGQRALIAWGMGWEPAQKISGRDWLYPYLIYSLTDSYAAIRFDAWKSLQTLPGFNDFSFTYTASERSLSEAAAEAYQKWLQRVHDLAPAFPQESALEKDGRFQTDIFQKLRSARDEKPILLAE